MYILFLKGLEKDKTMRMTIKTKIMKKVKENLVNLRLDFEYLKNMIENGNIFKYKMV